MILKVLQSFQKFPKSIYFILGNTFLERFNSGGIFAILALYLNQQLIYNQNQSTAIYHVNDFILHSATILGAILADSFIGLYKTLLIMTLTFAVGSFILMIAAMDISLLAMRSLSFVAFFAIAVGAGCCRCNFNVFGANQFKLPEQTNQFNSFYSIQFCVLKIGQVIGIFSFPLIRESISCFGRENCNTLAFGVATIGMLFSCYILWKGRNTYVNVKPSGNIIVKFSKCIRYAIKRKYQDRVMFPRDHWLEHAEPKYGREFVNESKMVMDLIVIFLPLTVFWALVQQQNSRWIFQASKMNSDIGFYTIKHDQMVVLIPIFTVILVPFFDGILYPLIAKIGIKSQLHKVTCGMICAAISFVISAYLEVEISESQISIFYLIPQYLLIAAAEVLVWVSCLGFAYNNAPSTMKSIINSFVYLTVAGGNLIVILISGIEMFDKQMYEFIFFACLMFIVTIVFILMSHRYKCRIDIEDINENKLEA